MNNNLVRVALVAAVLVVAVIIGANLLPRSDVGPPPPTPSPQPLPSQGSVVPGRYWLNAVGDPSANPWPRIAVTLPAGWTADGDLLLKNYGASDAAAGPALVAWQMSGTFVDPCTNHTLVKPTPGPGIDALADAFAHQPGTTAGPPTAVTVDGYSGKFVELTVTSDFAKCGGNQNFWIWASPDGNSRYVQGTNEMDRMYILDVEGRRFTFNARIPARTTPTDRAELESIIGSIDIEP